MSGVVHIGDGNQVALIAEGTQVQCVVTYPPYWGLRL